MPGTLGYGWRQGNRGEYLAQYFLTALGLSAPVIRQEDIGIDFYCALGKEEDRKYTFHSPYAVQVGSASSKEFVYGGVKDGKWRKASLDWLFSQELPLFVGTIDSKAVRFRLYATNAMWLLHYQFSEMTRVELCPDTWHDPLKNSRSRRRTTKNKDFGDGHSYRVPLFNPIVDLTLSDLETDKRLAAIDAMEEAVKVEQNNITNRRLGIHIVKYFPGNASNNASMLKRIQGNTTFWSSEPGRNVSDQIEALRNVTVVLALNFSAQGDVEKIKHLAPIFRLLAPGAIPRCIEEKLPTEIQEIMAHNAPGSVG